jgi:dienelactone hydrolase
MTSCARAALIAAAVALPGSFPSAVGPEAEIAPTVMRIVSYAAPGADRPLTVSGILRIPRPEGARRPGVVVLHGSAGMDSRGRLHADDLSRIGIATLEIDMWGARNLASGATERPAKVHETLPDLAGALALLANHPAIDPQRLGVVGFSWGGVQAMLAATRPIAELWLAPAGVRVAGLVAFYPVCWGYNRVPGYDFRELGEGRLLILTGERDRYDDDQSACPRLVEALSERDRRKVIVHVYPGAEHGFNMLEPPQRYADPFLHRGKGGEGLSAPHPAARAAARQAVSAFFERLFFSPSN